jgi:hypothetical protein
MRHHPVVYLGLELGLMSAAPTEVNERLPCCSNGCGDGHA